MEKMNEKKCKFCKRTIVGKSKLGICPDCVNKAGNLNRPFLIYCKNIGI